MLSWYDLQVICPHFLDSTLIIFLHVAGMPKWN